MTSPGVLRERLVLEAPVDADDGAGGVVRSYAPTAFLWAAVDPVQADPAMGEAGAGAALRYRVTVRAGRDITTRHRLRQGTRAWRIRSVRPADSTGRFLAIDAEEHAD